MSLKMSRGIRASKYNLKEVDDMKNIFLAIMMTVFLASCVVVHEHTVPPGQIKKQTAPGQMKKY